MFALPWQLHYRSDRLSEVKGGILPSLGATKQTFSVWEGGSRREAATEVSGQPYSKDQEANVQPDQR